MGEVCSPCDVAFCQESGYHRIPQQYHRQATRRGPFLDPLLGLNAKDHLLVNLLGAGANGLVYLALQQPLQMEVAVKFVRSGDASDAEDARREAYFRQEADTLARLSHPNIVRLLSYGSFRDRPFIAMEYVPSARTLDDELQRDVAVAGAANPALVEHVIMQILHALEAAHRMQIVHRDIKPENVMLQRISGDSHFVRVVDFGLAKFLQLGQSTDNLCGTPAYMAPEQISRREIGPWTDLYAVGSIALEMLTRRRIFGETRRVHEVLQLKMDPEHRPWEALMAESWAPSLRQFFARALAWAPSERYRSVADFAQELRPALRSLRDAEVAWPGSVLLSQVLSQNERARISEQRRRLNLAFSELEDQEKRLDELVEAEVKRRLAREVAELDQRQTGTWNHPPGTSLGTRLLKGTAGDALSQSGEGPARSGGPGVSSEAGQPSGLSTVLERPTRHTKENPPR